MATQCIALWSTNRRMVLGPLIKARAATFLLCLTMPEARSSATTHRVNPSGTGGCFAMPQGLFGRERNCRILQLRSRTSPGALPSEPLTTSASNSST